MPTDLDFKPNVIFQAIRLVTGVGVPVSKVARRFEVPNHRVRYWVKRYSNLKVEEIETERIKHKPGRPSVRRG